MSFASDTGYLPNTIPQLMNFVRDGINDQFGTDYDEDTFLGTNFYKYFYALIQRLQENEVKTSEIFLRMQQYFDVTNEVITRPNTTHPGIIDYLAAAGYQASTKKPIDADAGKLYVCVNEDSGASGYAAKKLEICGIIKDCCVAGVISQGDQVETIALPNGQSFDFKFALPDETPIKLKLTINLSANNQFTILTDLAVSEILYANINSRYKLGLDFEPQRYFSVLDAPWASDVLLEWSDDAGGTWHSTVFTAAFDDLYTFELADITVVNT
jgi:hypothetical protein